MKYELHLQGGLSLTKALEDIIVLDLSQVYQGPYCTLLMAYNGAKVIKIEPTSGEVLRQREAHKNPHEFLMFNSNKRGMTLDLKAAEGKDIFLELVKQADVVVENFTPGVMKRLGLGYDTLREINPNIIYASATGYGLDGPYADFPGMDLTIQAISGIMATTGFEDSPPVKAGPAVCDILGGIHLYGGIMTALYQRTITGKGQLVEVAMHDTIYPTHASALGAYYEGADDAPERTGNRHSGLRMAPYNTYESVDGHVAIICVSERHWHNLATLMEREDLINKQGFENTVARAKNMEAVDNIVQAWTKTKNKWDLVDMLKEVHVPCAPVLSLEEVANDPHLRYREMIREVDHPIAGRRAVPGTPIKLSASPAEKAHAAPLIGQHSKEILQQYTHLDDETIDRLKKDNII